MRDERQQTNRRRRGLRAASLALLGLGLAQWPVAPGTAQQDIDCGARKTLCVAASGQEFTVIQDAVDSARPGDTVVVFAGDYEGFRISRSGKKNKRLTVRGLPGARIVGSESRSDEGIYLSRVSYVTLQGFEVRASGMRFGIGGHDATPKKPMRGLEILDNTVVGASSTNIYLSHVADSLVHGNTAADSVASHGIYLANGGSDGTTLSANVCYGNAKNGIHFNGDSSVGGDGLHTDLVVDGNVLFDNVANGLDVDGVQDSSFVNNLVYGNGRHGLRAFAIDSAAGPGNLVIANNTFADNGSWAVKLSEDEGGHAVFNNILLSDAGSLAVENADLAADHNVGEFYSLDGDDTTIDLEDWQAAGYGAHSFHARARKLFVKPRKGDYSLKASAPAIDAGLPRFEGERAPRRDLDGMKRPQGAAIDIGCYERSDAQAGESR